MTLTLPEGRPQPDEPGIGLRTFPLVIELELNSRCNRRCGYCPVSLDPIPAVPKWMSGKVLESVFHQLENARFDGRMSYHFYSEPLLRKDLSVIVQRAARMTPNATQVLYTNGDLLTDRRYRELIDAGISLIVVTRHDGDTFLQREKQLVLHPSGLSLTNRGGSLHASNTLVRRCVVPNELAVITATGDVLLCYEDARRENVFGNVLTEDLTSIWNGRDAIRFRQILLSGDRASARRMCRDCDNVAHEKPGSTIFAT